MKNALYLISALLLSSLLSCKKDEPETIKLHEIVKKYFYYKTGSWWEYEREDTLIFEKVIVRQGTIAIQKDIPREELDIRMRSDIIQSELDLNFLCFARKGEQAIFIGYSHGLGGTSYMANADSIYGDIFTVEGYSFERLDSIVVKGITYHDIIHIANSGASYLEEFFLAAGVGIVRKSSNHKVYNLIRYNVQ